MREEEKRRRRVEGRGWNSKTTRVQRNFRTCLKERIQCWVSKNDQMYCLALKLLVDTLPSV